MKVDQRLQKLVMWHYTKDVLLIALGVVCASIGLKGFLLPNKFIDGGVTGMSLLIEVVTGIDLSVLLVLINLPFVLMGARQISWAFALKSSVAIACLAILVHMIEIPVITSDRLLIAVFGGFFLGMGIGCAIRGGAVIDGTEVLAISISRRSSLTVGDVISIFNVCLFVFSMLLLDAETAMYAILTYLAASKTVDFLINGIEEYIGITIISHHAEPIRQMITEELGRGVTVYKGDNGYGKTGNTENRKILFCVVTRLEVSKVLFEIEKLDNEAFVVQHPIKDTKGGMIKKRPLH